MAKGAENFGKEKRMNDSFGYDVYGVRTICEGYYELKETEARNWTAVDIRLDFEQALSASILSPESRLMVGLHYGFGLSIMQISKLTKIKMIDCKLALDEAHEQIEAVMNGYETTFFLKFEASTATNIDEWLAGVRGGKTMPYDIPADVMDNMWNYLVSIEDRQVMAILNPKPQENDDTEEDEVGGYPFYPTSDKVENPMRNRDFNHYKDYDYFMEKDRKKITYYMALTEPDVVTSGLKVTGRKRVRENSEDGKVVGKGNIYDL
jgi:hypothetical protein